MNRTELKGKVIDIFEDFLEKRNVSLHGDEEQAIIYGADYDALSKELDSLFDAWKIEDGAWYVERWYDDDIRGAFEEIGIPDTEENLAKAKRVLHGIFDDKSNRNEQILDQLTYFWKKEEKSWKNC